MVDLWYVGVLIYSSSATAMAGGIILQKYSLVCESARSTPPRPSYMQPLWLLGVTTYTLSAIGLSGALYFAAQSLLSPLMSVVLVANAILARLVLKESFGKHEAISTALIIVSVVITTIFADHGNQQYSEATLIEYYHQGPFIAYCLVVATTLALLYALNWHYAKRAGNLLNNALLLDDAEWASTMLDDKVGDVEAPLRASASRATGEGEAATAADAGGWRRTGTGISIADEAAAEWGEQHESGSAAAAGRSLSKAQSLAVMERRVSRVLPFTYGALAGVFGGVCSCMMKSAISVIATEAGKGLGHMLETWLVYLLVALLAVLWLGQMRWINKGVARFPATCAAATAPAPPRPTQPTAPSPPAPRPSAIHRASHRSQVCGGDRGDRQRANGRDGGHALLSGVPGDERGRLVGLHVRPRARRRGRDRARAEATHTDAHRDRLGAHGGRVEADIESGVGRAALLEHQYCGPAR